MEQESACCVAIRNVFDENNEWPHRLECCLPSLYASSHKRIPINSVYKMIRPYLIQGRRRLVSHKGHTNTFCPADLIVVVDKNGSTMGRSGMFFTVMGVESAHGYKKIRLGLSWRY